MPNATLRITTQYRGLRSRASQPTTLFPEAAAVGVSHPVLGQVVVLVTYAPNNDEAVSEQLLVECKKQLPGFMVPARIMARHEPLPRNPNGKIDRKKLSTDLAGLFEETPA